MPFFYRVPQVCSTSNQGIFFRRNFQFRPSRGALCRLEGEGATSSSCLQCYSCHVVLFFSQTIFIWSFWQWDGLENKSTVFIYGGGAIVAVWLSSIVVGAINSVPLVTSTLSCTSNLFVNISLQFIEASGLHTSRIFCLYRLSKPCLVKWADRQYTFLKLLSSLRSWNLLDLDILDGLFTDICCSR